MTITFITVTFYLPENKKEVYSCSIQTSNRSEALERAYGLAAMRGFNVAYLPHRFN